MSLKGKRVLVTGAGGFIGSHLTEALIHAGARTRALVHYNARGDWGHLNSVDSDVRREMEVVVSDICDRSGIRRAVEGCEVVFHLAALIGIPYSYQAPQSYVSTNIEGTLNVLEACRDCGVQRVLQTSTSEVYGTAQYTPIDERHPLHAQSPYAATKIGADQLGYTYFASFQMPVVIVRPFNTFGPRQSARAVIPTIISQALVGSDIELGSTATVRDFLFVRDNARGFMAAALAPADKVLGEVINLGTGRGITIGQVVELVGNIVGNKLRVTTVAGRQRPEKSEVLELVCNANKAADLTRWRATTSLEDGLAETVRWIGANRELYRLGEYSI
ncbi:MAG: GDP-mannose 4,6-dehydratase [Planctomycetes bacterium]|nr:GDP-mannose 4,6-dehydratase [Planctomycetota bacterium]